MTVGTGAVQGACASGIDYTVTSPQTVSFAVGESSKTISFTVCGDTLPESDEVVTITLSSPSGLTISDGTGTLTIQNDDTQGYVTIADAAMAEGSSGANTSLSFTVSLKDASGNALNAPTGGVQVTATPSDSSPQSAQGTTSACQAASSTRDYTTTAITVTIPAGSSSATASVPVCGDTVAEPNETFRVTLTAPTNNEIGRAHV